VESRDAIAALVYAYAEHLDAGDLDAVADLFARGSYGLAGAPLSRGTAAVRAALGAVKLHGGSPRTKHVTTNLVVDVDDGAGMARARSYFTVLQATDALPLQAIVAGRYHDRFERADGLWRFTERLIHLDLVGDVRDHLHGALPGGRREKITQVRRPRRPSSRP
jgi:3-phenylpropionate/cinnamic acid dioxygenase small subunit